jgi:aminopeptidase
MADPRVERLAEVLVRYSVDVQPGQLVVIEGASVAADLIRALYRAVLAAGAHAELRIGVDGVRETLLTRGSDAQLDWLSPRLLDDVRLADARIQILAETNTRSLSGVDPARQARLSRSREPIRRTVFDRTDAGEYRWVITGFPTNAAAQEARMSLADYTEFVYGAAQLADVDPIGAWRALGERIGRLAEWLGTVRELRITGPGTDLRLGVEGRSWISCDGTFNFPDGECFTGPVEDSVDGEISFTYPAIFHGRAIEGVHLRFSGGDVVEATATRGQDFLEEMLALDDGARRVGEFSFGLNDAVQVFTGETLFDEKIGGTVHLALGESYPESGGVNRSALHWDMVCDLRRRSEVFADGELVYRDGRFLDGRF